MSGPQPIQHITSYLERAQSLCDRFPLYSLLDELSKSPPRSSRSIVTVLEFYPSANHGTYTSPCQIKDFTLNNVDAIKTYIQGIKSTPSKCRGRLYLLEDPSKEFAELLGNEFNVDPNTFASYIYCPDRSKAKASFVARSLPSRQLNTQQYSLKYHEVRDLPDGAPEVQQSRVVAIGNIPRSISTFRHGATKDTGNYITGAIRRNISCWYNLDETTKIWNGLLRLKFLINTMLIPLALTIVDPEIGDELAVTSWEKYSTGWTIKHCQTKPYLSGPLDFSPWYSTTSNGPGDPFVPNHSTKSRDCLREAIVGYWMNVATQEEIAAAIDHPKNSFIFGNLRIAQHWIVVLEYLNGVISELETELWKFEEMPHRPSPSQIREVINQLRLILTNVNRWRRRVWWFSEDIKWNLEGLSNLAGLQEIPKSEEKNLTSRGGDVLSDFQFIHDKVDTCRERIESLLPVVFSIFSLLEAQQSSRESKYGTWLAIVATVFLPLSLTAGIFSMAGSYAPNGSEFWIYWVVSIGLILLIAVFILAVRKSGLY
jgi:CorA-like Mg2+ transporter protein